MFLRALTNNQVFVTPLIGTKILIIDDITLSCANCIPFNLNLLCLLGVNKLTLVVSEVCFLVSFLQFYRLFLFLLSFHVDNSCLMDLKMTQYEH